MTENLVHKFGADPEVFIINSQNSGKNTPYGILHEIIPPIALITDYGKKYKEIKGKKVLIENKNFQWSEDGAAIELQINPSNNLNTLVERLHSARFELNKYLSELGLQMSTQVTGFFDVNKYWKERDDMFRSCVIFGCDPDMSPSLYYSTGLDEFPEELDVSEHPYRYAGGHIHIQAPKDNPNIYMNNWEEAAILFDFIVGLKNVTYKRPDSVELQELARLKYYGKPGRIRLQNYDEKNNIFGIEYRVMSNYWLHQSRLMGILFNAIDLSTSLLERGIGTIFLAKFEDIIPDMYKTIMNRDLDMARKILIKVTDWLLSNRMITLKEAANQNE